MEETRMADLTPQDDNGEGRGRGAASSTPRWAKVIGIVVGVLVLLLAIKMLTVGGGFDLGSLHKRFAGVHGG
jgi:hypothetical protein